MNGSLASVLCFLIALAASLAYGYWLGNYARQHGWTEACIRRRAGLLPYCAGAMATLAVIAVRVSTGKGWSAEGSPGQPLFWAMLGFLIGGGLTTVIVLRRARPGLKTAAPGEPVSKQRP